MTGHCHQFLLYLGTEGHSAPSRCLHICLSVCFSQMAGITSDSHFGIHRKRTCRIEKQSGGCFLLVYFFFLSGLFPPCVALFPICSVSCLSNDHFEAMFSYPVSFFKHIGVYFHIFPHTAWVKGDRGKGHDAVRKVSQMRDELPAQPDVCTTRILDTAFPHWKELQAFSSLDDFLSLITFNKKV